MYRTCIFCGIKLHISQFIRLSENKFKCPKCGGIQIIEF